MEPTQDEIVTVPDDVIDSIAMLTGMSIGDVRGAINDDKYIDITLLALTSFKHTYYKYGLGAAPEQTKNPPTITQDNTLLTSTLHKLETQLNDPLKTNHERRVIKDTIDNLKLMIAGYHNGLPVSTN